MSSLRKSSIIQVVFLTLAVSTQAQAQANQPVLEKSRLSIGAGISDNKISKPKDDGTGVQFFANYALPDVNLIEGVGSAVEVGFMDFGFDSDSTGIWGSYVIDGNFSEDFGWLAQGGLDFGDDSGLLLGAGLKFRLNSKANVRLDYVVRDEVDSLQVNFLYHL